MSNGDYRTSRDDEPQPAIDDKSLALIEEQAERSIRRVWHDGRMFFSVIDVVSVLTDAATPRVYWGVLKHRLEDEENFRELLANCQQLKLPAGDGKFRETDCADFPTMVSIVHALPALRRRTDRNSLTENAASSASPCGIYAIMNMYTNEQYIGSSDNIPQRFEQHKALLRRGKHHAPRLQEAWNTYGEAAFAFVVLEELSTREHLETREQLYLDAEQPAYNEATVANNVSAFPPISEERIQQLILALYDIQRAATTTTTPIPLFEALRDALVYGIVKPGPNFHILAHAEADGVASWEALRSFLRQQH